MTENYQQVYDYIIEAIDTQGHDKSPHSLDEKLQFLRDTFKAEYGWHFERYGNEVNALKEWLSGLPSACNIAFHNYEILELSEKWGRIKPNATDRQQWRILESWFAFIAMRIQELWRKHNIKLGESSA